MSCNNNKDHRHTLDGSCHAALVEPAEVPDAHVVWNHGTGAALVDASGKPVSLGAFLGSEPLRNDIDKRDGPGRTKISYMSGSLVVKTLNEAFGHDGWSLSIISSTKDSAINLHEKTPDNPPKWVVNYISHVRITLSSNGAFREDFGICDSIDRNLATATANALKGSITDGMKRAARLFGEKLGNSLSSKEFKHNTAPIHLSDAIHKYQISQLRVQNKFLEKEPLPAPSFPQTKQPAPRIPQNQQHSDPLPIVKAEVVQNPSAPQYHDKTQKMNIPAAAASKQPPPPPAASVNAPHKGRSDNPNAYPSSGAVPHNSFKQTNRPMMAPGNLANQVSNAVQVAASKPLGLDLRSNNMKPKAHDVRDLDKIRRSSTGNADVDRDNVQKHNNAHKNRLSDSASVLANPSHSNVPIEPTNLSMAPQTAAQGLQAIFGSMKENELNESDPSRQNKRPPTAVGYRTSIGAPGNSKKPRMMGGAGPAAASNPYQKIRH